MGGTLREKGMSIRERCAAITFRDERTATQRSRHRAPGLVS
jgi:hypothetical protein